MKTCVISPGVVHAVPRTVAMARYLDEVDFIDMTGTADRVSLERAGIRYHRPEDGGQSRLASLNLMRLLDRLAPDVIVCHYGSGDHFFTAVAWGRCPIAVIAMGNDVLYDDGDSRVTPMRALLTRMGLRRSAFISAKSQFIAAALGRLGVKGRVDINYWGSDLGRFRPGDASEARRKLELPPKGPLVLSPRAIEPLYNIAMIIEAFAEVVRIKPDSNLVVIGRSNSRYVTEVMATIERLGLTDHVRIPGEIPFAELSAWYQASDIVVSMASVEGFPNTVLEVMACEVPVLVGDIPQVHELLADGVNAGICALSPPAIAHGLLRLLEKDVSAPMVLRAKETALQAGNLDANGQRFATELRAVVESVARQEPRWLLSFRLVLATYLVLKRCFPRLI